MHKLWACYNGYPALGFIHGQSLHLFTGSYLSHQVEDITLAVSPLSHIVSFALSTARLASKHSWVSFILTTVPWPDITLHLLPYCLAPLSSKISFKSFYYSPFILLDFPFFLEPKLLPLPLHWNSSWWGHQWPPWCCEPGRSVLSPILILSTTSDSAGHSLLLKWFFFTQAMWHYFSWFSFCLISCTSELFFADIPHIPIL